MDFNKDGYYILNNAVSKDVCEVAAREFEMARDLAKSTDNDLYAFNDDMVDKSFSWYSPLIFESLSDTIIKRKVEEIVGESVYPTYTYARIYYNGAEMKYHTDRSSSEFSVSLCVKVDPKYPWHLQMKTKDGNTMIVDQEPGDAVMYYGNDMPHWRDIYSGTEQINAFFFFVRANGPRSILRYDTRPMLGMPSSSRRWDSEKQNELFLKK